MELLLVLCLCSMTILAFELSNKDIISPWFLSCLSFLSASLLLAVVAPKWGVELQSNTVWSILFAVAFFGIGEVSAKILWNHAGYQSVRYFKCANSYIQVEIVKYVVVLAIETVMLLLYIYKSILLVISNGLSGSLADLMIYLRFLAIHTNASLGLMGVMFYYIGFSFSLVAAFVLINNILVSGEWQKRNFLLLTMILEGFVFLFFSTSRYNFIIYLVAVAIIFINRLRASGHNKKMVNAKGVKYAVLLGILGISLFFLLGLFSRKNSANIFNAVAGYVASPIVALNEFINGDIQKSQGFGGETLLGIRSMLMRFGYDIQANSRILEFIKFGNENSYTTNVYTSLRRYLNDFGFWGMCLVQWMFGFVYNILYMVSFNKKKSVFIILYSYLNYKLVLQFFDEEFLTTFLSIDEILSIICLIIAYYIFCHPITFRKFKRIEQQVQRERLEK